MDPKNKNQKHEDHEPQVGPVGAHNSGQMSPETPHQVGTTPAIRGSNQTTDPTQDLAEPRSDLSDGQDAHALDKEDIPERAGIGNPKKVNHDAVRESYAEAQNDPIPDTEPEDGEKAA